jgi:3'(2'), 5'-bisphosphate nucleotidase
LPLNLSADIIKSLLDLAAEAGDKILEYYHTDIQVREKIDKSPVTEADEKAEELILNGLAHFTPTIPAIGEESYSAGKRHNINNGEFWLVDALDGTKEFINKRAEFTVNIALINDGISIFGIVHAPALARTFWGSANGAFSKNEKGHIRNISTRAAPKDGITVVSSRSNREGEQNLLADYNVKNIINLGSSLKICLIAAGEADLYPRLGPTSEWDTAAGHAILTAAGGSLTQIDGSPFLYGKDTIRNPSFIAQGPENLICAIN